MATQPETSPRTADVLVSDHGSLVLVLPLSQEARDWIDRYVTGETSWLGRSLAVEHRYAPDLLDGMIADGLIIIAG